MKAKSFYATLCILAFFIVGLVACSPSSKPSVVRLGFFPNITHAQALLMQSFASNPIPDIQFPQHITIEYKAFNAGPSAMEALIAQSVDLSYVGPSPVLNTFLKTNGTGVHVISGATRGGAALVVKKDRNLRHPTDFKQKRIATPQLGNTQDIACRHWFLKAGMKVTMTGGDVNILPTANPDQLALFMTDQIDAVWTVEPWVSRLLTAGGKIVYSEPFETSLVTVLSASDTFAKEHPDKLKAILLLHQKITRWMNEHPKEAQERIAQELSRLTKQKIPLDMLQSAWTQMRFDPMISEKEFILSYNAAVSVGVLKDSDLNRSLLHDIVKK